MVNITCGRLKDNHNLFKSKTTQKYIPR